MFLIAEELFKNKINVILDATFTSKFSREKIKKIAKKYKTPFKIFLFILFFFKRIVIILS